MQPTLFNMADAMNSPTAKTIPTIMNRAKKKEKVDSSQIVHVLTEQTTSHATGLGTPPAVTEYRDFPERSVKLLNKNHIQEKSKQFACRGIKRLSSSEVEQILHDYGDPTITIKGISERHRVAIPAIIALARRAGVPHRGRGRRPMLEPSPFHRQILEAARNDTFENVGRRFGRTRQRMAQICHRWREWFPNGKRELPLSRRALLPAQPKFRLPLRNEIVCFRLAMPETAALKAMMKRTGLPTTVSLGAGARAVLLMTLMQTTVQTA